MSPIQGRTREERCLAQDGAFRDRLAWAINRRRFARLRDCLGIGWRCGTVRFSVCRGSCHWLTVTGLNGRLQKPISRPRPLA